jgi:hypothetical protein
VAAVPLSESARQLFSNIPLARTQFSELFQMTDDRLKKALAEVNACVGRNPKAAGEVIPILNQLLDQLSGKHVGWTDRTANERKKRKERRGDFEYTTSRPYLEFQRRGWGRWQQPEILDVARMIGALAHLDLPNEAKRTRTDTFKWLDDHWDATEHWLPHISAGDGEGAEPVRQSGS